MQNSEPGDEKWKFSEILMFLLQPVLLAALFFDILKINIMAKIVFYF